MADVAEWLSGAGVTLFFAGSTYAVIKASVVESWPRVTSKRISADVRAVAQGTFDFSRLEHLLAVSGQDAGEDEETDTSAWRFRPLSPFGIVSFLIGPVVRCVRGLPAPGNAEFALESLSGGLGLSDLDPFVYRPWLPLRGAVC